MIWTEKTISSTHWFLSHNQLLHLLHLRHVVFIGLELSLTDPLVNANQSVPGYVLPIVHTWNTWNSSLPHLIQDKRFNQLQSTGKSEYSICLSFLSFLQEQRHMHESDPLPRHGKMYELQMYWLYSYIYYETHHQQSIRNAKYDSDFWKCNRITAARERQALNTPVSSFYCISYLTLL